MIATPYQVTDPDVDGAQARASAGVGRRRRSWRRSPIGSSGFAYIERKASLDAAAKIEKLDLPGIALLPDSRRIYPQGELASQVIGTVGVENQGLTGLEASEDELLHGTDGEREVVRDALGDELERQTIAGAEAGSDLQLTLDADLQAETESVLAGIGTAYQPDGATAVVMDPRSSDVLAMANWPPFDPTELDSASPDELRNMATGFTYEPGSTFKAFTVAGALEDGVVTPQTSFDLPPTLRVADRTIEESHPRGTISALGLGDHPAVLERRRRAHRARRSTTSSATRVRRQIRPLGATVRVRSPDRDPVCRRRAGDHPRPR